MGSISGLGRSPGKGNGNPLQYAFFHGKSHGQRSLVDYSPLGHKEHRHNVEVVVSNTPQDSLLKKEAAGVLTPKSYTCNWMTQATWENRLSKWWLLAKATGHQLKGPFSLSSFRADHAKSQTTFAFKYNSKSHPTTHYRRHLCAHAQSLQSCPTLCDPTDCSPPAPLSMGFSRQEYWSGLPCLPPPGDLPNSEIKPKSLVTHALQIDSLSAEPPGNHIHYRIVHRKNTKPKV